MAVVLMSKAELSRVDTLVRVGRGELPVAGAASLLGLSERQVFRLLARFRSEGAADLASRRRGRPSNRRLPDAAREAALAAVRERYLLGGTIGYDFITGLRQDAALELDALADALHGNGYTLPPRFRFRTPVSDRLLFETTASGTYASGDYMENFFGVTPGDAKRSGLHPYDANSGFKDVAFTASLTYGLGEHWSLTGLGSFERLLGDAADSPIVNHRGSEDQGIGALQLSYRF